MVRSGQRQRQEWSDLDDADGSEGSWDVESGLGSGYTDADTDVDRNGVRAREIGVGRGNGRRERGMKGKAKGKWERLKNGECCKIS